MLHGRDSELAAIGRVLAGARAGEGDVLALRGEPGIGKSALLDAAAASARAPAPGAAPMRVLRAVGVEAESALAYATLHQLLLPLLDRAGSLPPPQRRALGCAFGLAEGDPDAPADAVGATPFLVGVAALTLLSEAAGEQPLLCVVDDLQWADAASRDALAFVARRLSADPVALLLAIRDGDGAAVDTAGIDQLRLAGLDDATAGALLDERSGERLAPGARAALLRVAHGNPLALIELPDSIAGAGPAGDPLRAPLPLAGELEQAFLARARRGGPELTRLLLLAAAEGSGQLATIRAAAPALGLDPAALESDAAAALLGVDGTTATFRHPLVRSAVYHGASAAERRAAHQALAAAAGDAGRRAWHLAAAAEGPDEAVAQALEEAAERTLRRSGHAAAASELARAAELSEDDGERARRFVLAADAARQSGDAERTRALLDAGERLAPDDRGVQLDAIYLRGVIEQRSGVPATALTLLIPAVEEALPDDPLRAVRLLNAAADSAFHAGDLAAMERLARLAQRMGPLADGEDAEVLRLMLARVAMAQEEPPPPLDPQRVAALERLEDPEGLARAGGLAWGVGDYELGRRLRARAVAQARARGAAGTLAWALAGLVVDTLMACDFATAEMHSQEALVLARETGQPNTACIHAAMLASLALIRGREAEGREGLEQVQQDALLRRLSQPLTQVHATLADAALATGRADEALLHFERMWRPGPVPPHPGIAHWSVPSLVEAAVRAGRPQACEPYYSRFSDWVERTGAEPMLAQLERCRALLADDPAQAERHFVRAFERYEPGGHAFELARTELLFGEFLRRERRRVDARVHLRAALDTFERLGAPMWAERARAELRASGETARRRDPSTIDQLTPQELQIVRAVAGGAMNREVAAELFISPRTVDYHLRKVFRKLGISSRAELIRLELQEPVR